MMKWISRYLLWTVVLFILQAAFVNFTRFGPAHLFWITVFIVLLRIMVFMIIMDTERINEFEDGKRNQRFNNFHKYFESLVESSSSESTAGTASYKDLLIGLILLIYAPEGSIKDMFFENKPVVSWISRSTSTVGTDQEIRSYVIRFWTFYGHNFQERYFRHIKKEARRLRNPEQPRKLYNNRYDGSAMWSMPTFIYPPSFEKLAFDSELRDRVTADLSRLKESKDYCICKYLICGPPGSGKTSLVGAISNFLSNFDIYFLDFSAVHSRAQLHKLLTSTKSNSVLVVEDADSIRAAQTAASISLSDILDIVNGLWKLRFSKQLIIITASNGDRIDLLLQETGRMDRRIDLGYCRAPEFQILYKKYFTDENDHELMAEAKELLNKVNVTHCKIVKMFMDCGSESEPAPKDAMKELIQELRCR